MKTRSLLLCGALAVATALSGCVGTMVQKTVEWGNSLTRSATGADDPNNNSAMARAGRMSVSNTNTALGVVGIKSEVAPEAMTTAPTSAEQPAVAPTPAPEPEVSAVPKNAPAPAKKVTTKSSSVKPVATTMPRKQ